jgi:hypothetical protein
MLHDVSNREEFRPVDDRADRPDETRRDSAGSPLAWELPIGVTGIVLSAYRHDENSTIFPSLIVKIVRFSDRRS